MKTYKEIYQHLIYEWNSKLIKQQWQNTANYEIENNIHENNVICQRIYCDNFSQEFEDYFVEKFKEIWQNIQKDFTNNYLEIPFKLVAKKLSQEDFKDYKDFGMFLNILKESNGILELCITNQVCYYECPIDFYKQPIKLYSETPDLEIVNLTEFNKIMLNKVKNLHEIYLKQITKNQKTLTNALKVIRNNLINQYQWGKININFRYFKNPDYIDDLGVAVSHEFQHLMDYLININYQQWNYCRYYSNSPHSSFSRDLPNLTQNKRNFEQINYFLDSGQFKTLRSTYCQYLRNCFLKNTEIISKDNINDFIIALYQLCEFKFVQNEKTNENIHKYKDKISNMRDFKDIKTFFQVIYDDSLIQKYEFNTINKWENLSKTLSHELENQL